MMWRPVCRKELEMVTAAKAAKIAGVSERTIYRRVGEGSVHFLERGGDTFVSVSSAAGRCTAPSGIRSFESENRNKE